MRLKGKTLCLLNTQWERFYASLRLAEIAGLSAQVVAPLRSINAFKRTWSFDIVDPDELVEHAF